MLAERGDQAFCKIVEVGRYADGAVHYSAIRNTSSFWEDFSLVCEGVVEYKDSHDLINTGFTMDLRSKGQSMEAVHDPVALTRDYKFHVIL